ncbi:MAG: uroporphyrinogen decarboxylase family protein, partial [Promethearchaeota archaeon]
MDPRERLLKALENDGEPDKVPSFVEGMMAKFQSNALELYEDEIEDDDVILTGRDWTLFKFFKFDSAWLHSTPIHYEPLVDIDLDALSGDKEIFVNRMGHVFRKNRFGSLKYQTGFLNSEEIWKEWIDAGYFKINFDEQWVRFWEKSYEEMVARGLVPVPVTTCFEPIREAFSFGMFAHFYRKKMGFLKMLAKNVLKNLMEVAKGWCDAGFEIVTWADDCAYKGRVMFPPKIFDELVAPIYKALNDYCHKRGVLTFFHSDGFTEPFFDGLIRAGFNGIQSLEPAAGMNLAHLKEKFGSKVCLIGNIDCSELLPFGNEHEVVRATKQCIKDGARGGGYVFGPTTD